MNKKTIQLTTEQAQELYKQNPDFRSTILSDFTDVELGIEKVLKTWEELRDLQGWYINKTSVVIGLYEGGTFEFNKNIFATEKQAKSALAMAQLSQLMKDLGDECNLNWNLSNLKFGISRENDLIYKSSLRNSFEFLAFKTESIRDKFMEKHEQLIKEYFMI